MKGLFSILLAFTFLACHALPERTSTDVVRRTISIGDTLIYSLGQFTETESARIQEQARHAAISTINQDSANQEMMYYYVPLPDFSGDDFVEMHSLLNDDEHPGSTHTIITEMTIVVND
jgi:hypothetical protein